MNANEAICVVDDFVPLDLSNRLIELIRQPIWSYGWRSNRQNDRFCFWNVKFAGHKHGRESCEDELRGNELAKPVFALWELLAASLLAGHEPLRVYANSHTYGIEGYLHRDSNDSENYFTTIYYAHPVWRRNWSGEILFFAENEDEIVRAILPKPGRLVIFPGSIPHMAHAPSRECPELRTSIVIKTQRRDL